MAHVLPFVVFFLSAGALFRSQFAHRTTLRALAGVFALASGVLAAIELADVGSKVPGWWRSLQSRFERPASAAPGGGASSAAPLGDGACARVRRYLALDRRWVAINDGSCRVAFEVAMGDVVFDSTNGERIVGADDPWARSFAIEGITRVRALSGKAQLTYVLCPPDTAGQRVKLDCSPE